MLYKYFSYRIVTGEIGDTNNYPDKGLEFLGEISDPDVQQGALFASTEKVTRRWISGIDTSGTFNKSICFDASRSNAIYSNGNATIQPKSMSVQYLIKYWIDIAEGCTVADFE